LLKQAGLPDGCFNVVHGDKVAIFGFPAFFILFGLVIAGILFWTIQKKSQIQL